MTKLLIDLNDTDRATLEALAQRAKLPRVEVIRNLIRDCARRVATVEATPRPGQTKSPGGSESPKAELLDARTSNA